jgi:AcrR family transcriptional regulator
MGDPMARSQPYIIAPDPRPEGRREHKKARTRDDLVEAALRLFQKGGFEATTVEDIADAAGVSPRTFFRYFASKEEVFFHKWRQELADLEKGLESRPPEESAFEAVRASVVAYLRVFQAEPEFHLLRARIIGKSPTVEAYSLQLLQKWHVVLAQSVARRMRVDPVKDVRPILLAGCAIMAMRAALAPWMQTGGKASLEDFANAAFEQLQRGFPS